MALARASTFDGGTEIQQTFGVTVSARCNVIGSEHLRKAIEKGATAGVGGAGAIDREEQAIGF